MAPSIPTPRLLRGEGGDESAAIVVPVFVAEEPMAVVFLEGSAEQLTLARARVVGDIVGMWLRLMLAAT